MLSLGKVIHDHRILLLSKGYTEGALQVFGQPNLFLRTLQTKLMELDGSFAALDMSKRISHILPADFEKGWYASHLTFDFNYTPATHELSIVSLGVTDYAVSIHFPVNGDPAALLPTAKDVVQSLKNWKGKYLEITAPQAFKAGRLHSKKNKI